MCGRQSRSRILHFPWARVSDSSFFLTRCFRSFPTCVANSVFATAPRPFAQGLAFAAFPAFGGGRFFPMPRVGFRFALRQHRTGHSGTNSTLFYRFFSARSPGAPTFSKFESPMSFTRILILDGFFRSPYPLQEIDPFEPFPYRSSLVVPPFFLLSWSVSPDRPLRQFPRRNFAYVSSLSSFLTGDRLPPNLHLFRDLPPSRKDSPLPSVFFDPPASVLSRV